MEGFPDEAAAVRIDVEGRVLRVERGRASGENSGFAVLLSNAVVAGSEGGKFFFLQKLTTRVRKTEVPVSHRAKLCVDDRSEWIPKQPGVSRMVGGRTCTA